MRLAVWRDRLSHAGKSFAKFMAPAAPPPSPMPAPQQLGDIDLRAIWRALVRQRKWVIVPTAAMFVLAMIGVNVVSPRYKSEARILIDGRENVFLRPNGERSEERTALDAEAVTSQVQLLLSRDLAREVIRKNHLEQLPEFDPVLRGISPLKTLLALFGIGRDPFNMSPEERVLDAYYERLTAYAVDKSRVMVIEFQSRDPELAAQVANSIADEYLVFQQAARQDQAKSAGQWLSGEIDSLRKKVADAEDRVEAFRSKSNLFIGTNSTSLSNQQLGELNTQLNNARGLKSDAESRARAIRDMLQTGKPIEAAEVLNSELVRRLAEQRVTLRAQLAEQSSTLLDQHPRIKELKAQIADLDRQMRDEASKISRSLENDARIAGARVDGLNASLDQLKKQATSTNGQDVQLRALEREAKAQRDLLESYLAKYREATTRENIDAAPADGRIISRAIVSNTPAFPKKLPIVLIATLAMLMLTGGYVVTAELLRMTAPRTGFDAAIGDVSLRDMHPRMGVGVSEVDQLADELRREGEFARKITVIGARQEESVTLTALTLARSLSRGGKVVLVDLSMISPTLKAVSIDPAAPGLTDLMNGSASFGQIITRDRLSNLHLIGAGRVPDRSALQSPRLGMAIDALLRAYDHVVLDAGTAVDLPSALIAAQAHAVIVPAPDISMSARTAMRDQLLASGFIAVTILNAPASMPAIGAAGERVAAA
ncbi:MAG: exopolysaccharide transport family protein [Xanthobacteraceae bacterium]|nr:exopolysaccharide transport family protein [Xanthobacteraceae bacterium]